MILNGRWELGDTKNRLIQVAGSSTATYAYNADNARVTRVMSGVTTYYVGNWFEVTSSGAVTKYYYFGGRRVAMRTASGVTYLHGDHLGSTSVTSGATSSAQVYYAYGAVRATSGTIPTDYTFTGQKVDASTGLMYYGARYYDPALGRFISADTIVPSAANPQALNRYAYTLNNPMKYVDPSGHCVVSFSGGCERDENGHIILHEPDAAYADQTGIVSFIHKKMIDNANGEMAALFAYWNSCTSPRCYQDGANPQMLAAAGFGWINLPRNQFGWLGAGDWDYKPDIQKLFDGDWQQVNDTVYKFDVWTNVHFGFVGKAAGFSDEDLLIGAGVAQAIALHPDASAKPLSPKTWDDPQDQVAIQVGIQLWNNFGSGVRPGDIVTALEVTPGLNKRPAE